MTDSIERPEHEPIVDCRKYLNGLRIMTLYTYKTTLRTSLQVVDIQPGAIAPTIELDREGRDKLIAELLAANTYEDLHVMPEANNTGKGSRHSMDVQYTRQSADEYTVWRYTSHRVGVVRKFGMRWLAISPEHRSLGSYASMSRAGNRLVEEDEKK